MWVFVCERFYGELLIRFSGVYEYFEDCFIFCDDGVEAFRRRDFFRVWWFCFYLFFLFFIGFCFMFLRFLWFWYWFVLFC